MAVQSTEIHSLEAATVAQSM